VPAWVKRDQARFPRAELESGAGLEILSPFAEANWSADARAFAALMKHLNLVDGAQNTVLMVQVENEVGMLPSARDASAAADARFAGAVPAALTDYLVAHRTGLVPELRALWERNGARTAGNWATLFGAGPAGEEIFSAWFFARYVDAVAAAGKAAYALPLFANVALNRPGKRPGEYPSGGPLPHLLDIWKAGAPALAFLSPDIYFPNFVELVGRYARPDNPLFIPEANRARLPEAGANAFFAIGEHDALGFSPFAIDALEQPEKSRLALAYDVLSQLAPALLAARGGTRGFRPPVSYEGVLNDAPQAVTLGDFTFNVSFIDRWTPRSEQQVESHAGLLIQLGPEEYLAAGSGFSLEITPALAGAPGVGIESAWEGRFVAGRWVPGRLLNGDETHQGRLVLIPRAGFGIQRIKLYRYR
jgi:beta-galactosidase GanA